MGGGKKKSSSLPSAQIETGGLYGSGTAGLYNSFKPTDFQKNLVETSQDGINKYLTQLINPTYDSEVFKAETAKRNALANQSFENNLINPLANRGLLRGSNVNTLANSHQASLINAESEAMAKESERVSKVLSELLNVYKIPLETLTGLQKTALSASQSGKSSGDKGSSPLDMFGSIFKGLF